MFKEYMRKSTAELRKVNKDDLKQFAKHGMIRVTNATGSWLYVSISDVDVENGSPRLGDMIARNPKNHEDMWLVSKQYFEDNFVDASESKSDKILMGVDNHEGWKLEDLLGQLITEIKSKSDRISDSDHPQRDMIISHNDLIITYLVSARNLQKETYRQLDAIEPNRGPENPRL
jgi:hypothetical protein